jgi:hypothetical protein
VSTQSVSRAKLYIHTPHSTQNGFRIPKRRSKGLRYCYPVRQGRSSAISGGKTRGAIGAEHLDKTDTNLQPPIQLNSLTGTYATSTYLAALKKSPKDLEALAKDVETFDQKIKSDEKIAAFIRMSIMTVQSRFGCALRTIGPD